MCSKFTSHPDRFLSCYSIRIKIGLLTLLLLFSVIEVPLLWADNTLITQEIRYHMPEAGEVYLVWGVNGWQSVPEKIQPPGTTVDVVMFTPMVLQGDTFVAKVQVYAGTTLDYGFQTRKKRDGTPTKEWVWDGDYQLTPGDDPVVEIEATVTLDSQPSNSPAESSLVTQEFRYHMPEAGEV